MISVAVLYPNQAGSKFDLDYFVHRHLPLVRDRLKPMGMRSLGTVSLADLERMVA